jgi:hypothetical protein
MLNFANLRTYVTALRSGVYTQIFGRLIPATPTLTNCYCAEGLLGHLAGLTGDELRKIASNKYDDMLPGAVYEAFLGEPVFEVNARCVFGRRPRRLTILNDLDRCTFPQIADLIEAEYLPNDVHGA